VDQRLLFDGFYCLTCCLKVKELTVDYTSSACRPANSAYKTCADYLANNTGSRCMCKIQFELKEKFSVSLNELEEILTDLQLSEMFE